MHDLKITQVEFLDDYKINILLCNGHGIIYDMKPKLKTIRFIDLAQKEIFVRGQVIGQLIIRWNASTEISLGEILNQIKQGEILN